MVSSMLGSIDSPVPSPQSPRPQTSHPTSHNALSELQETECAPASVNKTASNAPPQASVIDTVSNVQHPLGASIFQAATKASTSKHPNTASDEAAPSHTTDLAVESLAEKSPVNATAEPAGEHPNEPIGEHVLSPLVGPVTGKTPRIHPLPNKPPSPSHRQSYHGDLPSHNRPAGPVLDPLVGPATGHTPYVHPLPKRPPSPGDGHGSQQNVQSHNEPAGHSLGEDPQAAAQVNSPPNRKRSRSSATEDPVALPPPIKRRRKRIRKDKTGWKFSWELGHRFIGSVFHINGYEAWHIADKILQLPIPDQVQRRLVYFFDASVRVLCGAAGVVWPKTFNSPKWDGKGFYYPLSVEDSSVVELFAISCTLKAAIEDIEKDRARVVRKLPSDKEFFQGTPGRTMSHIHTMAKELFIFTDDCNALRRIDGDLAYPPIGDMADEIAAICAHTKALNTLGVHVELHLSPGHRRVPGNVAADAMAKRTQRQLFVQTANGWPSTT
ncbi:uncharacterized protein N7500_007400 [Penicillium coprophilum]|uniref:uncharacterized protein n=1 Tax=Penicillium coprophilum TaxID=36646 RepID=UPI00239AEF20|nr:uncharacterized protein N7500_007400 [Penicillium coprophilum]KAJ5165570.1 hypothetical protein N7500_007400 [Penicillium coprophilum]